MCIRILMILVVVSGYTAKPSDETKVVWNPVTPMEFGKDVKLVCNISCCVRNTALDQASWDAFIKNKSINIAANSHSRYPSKYSLLIWEDKCTLVIKNFSLSDVNVNYTCTYNFKSFNKKLKLNEDDFELQPKEDINRLVHDRVDRNSYFIGVNFTNVYPEPKCFVLHNGQDFTSNIVSKTSISGNFYTSYQTIFINDVKDGNIRMTCSIGKTTYMVKDKEFKLIDKDNANLSSIKEILYDVFCLVFALACVVIMYVIKNWMNITWNHSRGFCAIVLIYLINVYLSPYRRVPPIENKEQRMEAEQLLLSDITTTSDKKETTNLTRQTL